MGKTSKRREGEPKQAAAPAEKAPKPGEAGEKAQLELLVAEESSAPGLLEEQLALESGDEAAATFDAAVAACVGEVGKLACARGLFVAAAVGERRLAAQLGAREAELARAGARIGVMETRDRRLSADKAIILAELAKVEGARDKLSELCRTLQRQNKDALDQSGKRVEEEIAKRKDITDRFSATVDGIASKLEEQAASSKKQMAENDSLRESLSGLLGKFDLQQAHFDRATETHKLEAQLADAKRAHAQALADQEKARAAAFEHQAEALALTERELREQLASYGGKFAVFQTSLEQSNDAFKQYRERLDEMAKSKLKLEKENAALAKRAEAGDAKVVRLSLGAKEQADEVAALRAAKVKLERLCRTLQADRKAEAQAAAAAPSLAAGAEESAPP